MLRQAIRRKLRPPSSVTLLFTTRSNCYELRRICLEERLRKGARTNRRKVKSHGERSGLLTLIATEDVTLWADEKLSAFVDLERQVLTVTLYLESIHGDPPVTMTLIEIRPHSWALLLRRAPAFCVLKSRD